jgi:hypothetical protein
MKMILKQIPVAAAFAVGLFINQPAQAAINGSENFNGNAENTTNWGSDITLGDGVLTQTDQQLQYTASPYIGEQDYSYRPWILNQATYNTSWDVILDVHNAALPTVTNQVTSIGIQVFDANNLSNSVYAELYCSSLGALPYSSL